MAQRLRIFISSPGDVPDERLRTDLIIDKLAQEYSRYFSIESYRWEHEPMLASGHFQDAIEPPSASDIVILILWSRLGTALPERTAMREYHGLDGRAPVTGTEWEFEEALAAARLRGAPDILVFRNSSPTSIDSRDPAARAKSLEQLDALDVFWKRYFADRGVFLAGASEYRDIEEFAARTEESLRKLIERRIKAGAASGAGDTAPSWLGNPFRGLQAYEFEHAAIFFGRDAMVAKAAEQLTSQARAGSAFLLFVGASGSGKSSLVKAALVPRLMKPQRIEGVAILRRLVFRPGDAQDDLILGFAEALTRGPAQEGIGLPELLAPGQTAKDLATYLRTNLSAPTFAFTSALGRVTEAAIAAKRILPHEVAKIIIVIDQLEELFTLPQISADDRRAFVQLLHGLTHSGAVWVIATMRADFWHRILDLPELLALAEGPGRLEVPAPSPAEIAEMIRKPAQAAGLIFETNRESGLGLDTVLAEHAASEPGVLPLLSFTLDALYREDVERGGGHALTFAEYDRLGGLEGAIAKRADEVLESLPDSAKATAPRVLRALATLGGVDNDIPVARSVPLNSFALGSDARSVVDAFVAARLLVASTEGETATVRLAHESLISRWDRAREQLTADRRDLETRSLVERQYARWKQAEDSTREQLLLRDPDLANALDLEHRWGDELGANVQDFIARSHRRRRRRQQLVAAAAVVFGIVALAATAFGFIAYRAEQQAELARVRAVDAEGMAVTERDRAVQQRNGALVSQSRYLAAEADTLVKDGGVRQAIALLRVALPDPEHDNNRPLVSDAIVSAYNALYSSREKLRVTLPQDASAVTIAPDGKRLFIAVPGQLVLRGEQPERVLPHQFGPVSRLLLNGTGELVAMIGPGGAISVRRLADNHELMTHPGEGAGTQVYFFDGARRLLVVSPDNKIWHLIELDTGREIATHNLSSSTTIVSLVAPEQGIIIALGDSRILRLSTEDLSEQAAATTDTAAEYALALSPDAKSVYIAAAPDILTGRILVVDSETLALQRTFGRVVGGARFAAVSPKSRTLAVHGIIGIDFFDIASGERNFHLLASRDARRGGFFGPSGSDYIAYGPNGFIRRYAPELGVEMGAYRMGDGGSVDQIQELPDRSGFISISDHPSATVWSYDAQVISREYTLPLVIQGMDLRMPSPIDAFAFTPDGNEVLVSYADHSARRWNLQTGDVRVVRAAALKAESIDFVASLPGGVSVLAEKSGGLLIFSDTTGPGAAVGEFPTEPLNYLGDVGGGRVFAVSKAGVPFIVDLSDTSHPVRQELPALSNCPQQVSIPGRAFCVDKDSTIRVWDSRGDRLMLELPAPAQAKLHAGYISEDGATIAAGYSNGEVVVKSLSDGKTLAQRTLTVELSGEFLRNADRNGILSEEDRAKVRQGAKTLEVRLGPNSVAVSPDSKWLAVAMPDRSVKLIDLTTGETRDTSGIHRGVGQSIEFSPNGKLVAVVEAGEYRALNVYDVATGERLINLSLSSQPSPRLRRLSSGTGFTSIDKGGRIFVHPVFEKWQDLVSYLAREFPEPLTPKQRRAFFID